MSNKKPSRKAKKFDDEKKTERIKKPIKIGNKKMKGIGFVDYFNDIKGFGYIRISNKYISNDRIYFNYLDIKEKIKSLRKNSKVEFLSTNDQFGNAIAKNVKMTRDQPYFNNINYGIVKSYDNFTGDGYIKTKLKSGEILLVEFSRDNNKNLSLTTRMNLLNKKKNDIIGLKVQFELIENEYGEYHAKNIKFKFNKTIKERQREHSNKIKKSKDNMRYGFIKKYPLSNGNYGFITSSKSGNDIFFLGKDVKLKKNDIIQEGDEVKFNIIQTKNLKTGEKRTKAVNIIIVKKYKKIKNGKLKTKKMGKKSLIDFDSIKVPPSSKEKALAKKRRNKNNNNNNNKFKKKVTLSTQYSN